MKDFYGNDTQWDWCPRFTLIFHGPGQSSHSSDDHEKEKESSIKALSINGEKGLIMRSILDFHMAWLTLMHYSH